jgi:hypothetical protein
MQCVTFDLDMQCVAVGPDVQYAPLDLDIISSSYASIFLMYLLDILDITV